MTKSYLQKKKFILTYCSRVRVHNDMGGGVQQAAGASSLVTSLSKHRQQRMNCKWGRATNSQSLSHWCTSSNKALPPQTAHQA